MVMNLKAYQQLQSNQKLTLKWMHYKTGLDFGWYALKIKIKLYRILRFIYNPIT